MHQSENGHELRESVHLWPTFNARALPYACVRDPYLIESQMHAEKEKKKPLNAGAIKIWTWTCIDILPPYKRHLFAFIYKFVVQHSETASCWLKQTIQRVWRRTTSAICELWFCFQFFRRQNDAGQTTFDLVNQLSCRRNLYDATNFLIPLSSWIGWNLFQWLLNIRQWTPNAQIHKTIRFVAQSNKKSVNRSLLHWTEYYGMRGICPWPLWFVTMK